MKLTPQDVKASYNRLKKNMEPYRLKLLKQVARTLKKPARTQRTTKNENYGIE